MADKNETRSSAPSAKNATGSQIGASDQTQRARTAQEPNRNTLEEQRAAESGSTVTVTYSGDKRARLIRQTLLPGGEWSGGEEVVNRIEDEVEQSVSPGQRLVIEEIG